MISKIDKNAVRQRRHARVRKTITGTAETPRMNVYRSLNHIYVQIIDDSEKVITGADQYDFDLFEYAESVKFGFGTSETTYNLDEALQYVKEHEVSNIKYIMKMPVRDIVLGKTQTEEYVFQCGYRNPTELIEVLETSLTEICY